MKNEKLILKLEEAGIEDVELVGGKNASLGEMIQHLSQLGVRIPSGFIVTVKSYQQFLIHNHLESEIERITESIDVESLEDLRKGGRAVRSLILQGNFPNQFIEELKNAYQELSFLYKTPEVDVAVRSSATAEDLPDASFAGQQETFLNISGIDELLIAIRKCFASLFTDRAISYRKSFGYDHFKIGLSVCIQKMVRSDMASSGVAFSLDTESGFKDVVLINGSYGLGELVVQGAISPDEFLVFKPTLKQGFSPIIEKKLGIKDQKMIYGIRAEERVKVISTTLKEQTSFCLSESQISTLASWVVIIEQHYSTIKGYWCPMDVEWAVDGLNGELFIVQARPETIHSRKTPETIRTYNLNQAPLAGQTILTGVAVGDKIAKGRVKIIPSFDPSSKEEISFKKGDILVTDITDPDWEPLMKIASAIITNKGGRTCHAAIVARELGIPAIVACQNATSLLKDDAFITISCAEGDVGYVYHGDLDFTVTEINLADLPQTKTPIMLNVASPEKAFHFSHFPHKGVGLAREEFIINNYIKAHPLALIHHEELGDEELTNQINKLTQGFEDGKDYFIKKLSFGVAKIASAFYPSRTIVRFSDFKSNEYFNLLGGNHFEPEEENPMIGWRGASRYYSKKYKEAFGLECQAIKLVREEMGLTNVTVMIPFCRTVNELLEVYEVMEDYGLKRGINGLEVYLMAELPSNVILAEAFADHIDGFSIGSNDLTQLILGLDRDSSLVAHLYDERNDAVKIMIKMLIASAKRKGVKVGICGQGPSDFPDFAEFLVEEGIDSISVTPDSLFKTLNAIATVEQKLEAVLA